MFGPRRILASRLDIDIYIYIYIYIDAYVYIKYIYIYIYIYVCVYSILYRTIIYVVCTRSTNATRPIRDAESSQPACRGCRIRKSLDIHSRKETVAWGKALGEVLFML